MIKQKEGSLSKTPSLASVSTRVNSSNSLQGPRLEQAADSPVDAKNDKGSSVSKGFAHVRLRVVLALLVGCTYLGWLRYVMRMSQRAKRWGPEWLARSAAALLTGMGWLAGVRGLKDISKRPWLLPDRQLMVCMHPHGFAGIGPLTLLGDEPRRKNGKMENVFILAADIAFKIPFLRELFLLINARAANEAVIDDVFRRGGSVAVFPGGVHEQLRTDPNQEKISFPPNVGFVRQAIKHGVPLMPLYNFGENQQFGRWGLPFMPRLHAFQSRFGRVVEVGLADPNPSEDHVRKVFRKYCLELRRVFDEYKDIALPPAVAARGLKIEWRGHETEDLSESSLESFDKDCLLDARSVSKDPVVDVVNLHAQRETTKSSLCVQIRSARDIGNFQPRSRI